VKATYLLSEIARIQGKLGDSLRLAQMARQMAERGVQASPDDRDALGELSAALERIGLVMQSQGDLAGALESQKASLSIRDRLAKSEPSNPKWQRDIGVSQGRIGYVLETQGNLVGALEKYHVTRDIWDPINDVALIKVFAPFTAGANMQTIRLTDAQAEDSIAKPQNLVTVTGFGATKVGGKPVPGLMSVNVHYVERSTCNKGASYDGAITNGMICAGEAQGGEDSCQGDSGGPLTFHPLASDAMQIGIVSWGRGCAKELKYGVYTRIVAYRDWIMACMANPNTCPAK
jgi:hypothetical protein